MIFTFLTIIKIDQISLKCHSIFKLSLSTTIAFLPVYNELGFIIPRIPTSLSWRPSNDLFLYLNIQLKIYVCLIYYYCNNIGMYHILVLLFIHCWHYYSQPSFVVICNIKYTIYIFYYIILFLKQFNQILTCNLLSFEFAYNSVSWSHKTILR